LQDLAFATATIKLFLSFLVPLSHAIKHAYLKYLDIILR